MKIKIRILDAARNIDWGKENVNTRNSFYLSF
jgi:hypothetical protein